MKSGKETTVVGRTANRFWKKVRSIEKVEESFSAEIFEEYVLHLREKAKEKDRKWEKEKAKKEKEEVKERKEKEKEKEKECEREKGKERTKKDETNSENVDAMDSYGHKEEKKRGKHKDRKHQKRHQSGNDVSSNKDEKVESKKSHRHRSDLKKSSIHTHLNLIVKAGIKSIREITVIVPVEMVVTGSLARMGR